jgi:hypothetical protein
MPEEPHATATRPDHERTDVDARSIVIVGVVLALTCAVIYLVAWGLLKDYLSPERVPPVTNPLAAEQNDQPLNQRLADVPAPRLEGLRPLSAANPFYRSSLPLPDASPRNLHAEDLRPSRQPRLQSYGWVDRDKGIAHIPIEQAMRAALEMNLLPVQKRSTGGAK